MKITKSRLKQVIKEEIEIFNEETTVMNIALDIAGLVPGLGEPADFINGIDYAMKGDYLFSALSFISMIPELGDAIGKGGKIAIGLSKLGKHGKAATKAGQKATSAKKFQQASTTIKKMKTLLRGKKVLINSVFDKLEQSENEELQKHLPKVREALDIFIGQEELNELGGLAGGLGAVAGRAGQEADSPDHSLSGPEQIAEDSLVGLLVDLNETLEQWEQKEYPSDEIRYNSYFQDIQKLVEDYDPCVHVGQKCDQAHPNQSHEECIEVTINDGLQEAKRGNK